MLISMRISKFGTRSVFSPRIAATRRPISGPTHTLEFQHGIASSRNGPRIANSSVWRSAQSRHISPAAVSALRRRTRTIDGLTGDPATRYIVRTFSIGHASLPLAWIIRAATASTDINTQGLQPGCVTTRRPSRGLSGRGERERKQTASAVFPKAVRPVVLRWSAVGNPSFLVFSIEPVLTGFSASGKPVKAADTMEKKSGVDDRNRRRTAGLSAAFAGKPLKGFDGSPGRLHDLRSCHGPEIRVTASLRHYHDRCRIVARD